MAVYRQDRLEKYYTSNPIPTSFFFNYSVSLVMRILGTSMPCGKKKRCRDGVACVVFL